MGATTRKPAFEVDRAGLAKMLARKGVSFAVTELVSNSWDEDTTRVDIALTKADKGHYRLVVTDDNPEGFRDLSHAYTLFAESAKKGEATKRGRFNLGEKLVIAVCRDATLRTTKGRIDWTGEHRVHTPDRTEAGSVFEGIIPMSDDDAQKVERLVHSLLPPHGITTVYNGVTVEPREAIRTFEGSLRTETIDQEGRLKPTTRKTAVSVYEVRDGESAHLYELGIPVVETGDAFHVDVAQKIPVNLDRDNVPPGYLRDVRALVLNATADVIAERGIADARWVNDALEDDRVTQDAIAAVVKARYGDNVVTADPNDREAEKRAVGQGFVVIPGGAFSKAAWSAVRGAGLVQPAGKVTPSPRPDAGEWDGTFMDPDAYPENVQAFVAYAQNMAKVVVGRDVTVRVANHPQGKFNATYSKVSGLVLNFGRLGYSAFVAGSPRMDALLIHELAHETVEDHLSSAFYDECCRIGAVLLQVHRYDAEILDEPWVAEGAVA